MEHIFTRLEEGLTYTKYMDLYTYDPIHEMKELIFSVIYNFCTHNKMVGDAHIPGGGGPTVDRAQRGRIPSSVAVAFHVRESFALHVFDVIAHSLSRGIPHGPRPLQVPNNIPQRIPQISQEGPSASTPFLPNTLSFHLG